MEAQANREGVLAQIEGFRSEQKSNRVALEKEELDLINAKTEAESQLTADQKKFNAEQIFDEVLRLEALKSIYQEEREIELERLEQKKNQYLEGTQARLDAEIEYNTRKQELDQQLSSNEKALNEARAKNSIQWEKLTQSEKMKVAADGFNNLANVLGKETAAGKAAAIAAATISTYQSATDSYKSLASIPVVGPALGAAAAAAAVVSGMANVRKIMATKTPNSVAAPSVSAPSVPSQPPAFNIVGQGGQNQIAQALGQPVQAYVVANDVTTAQSLERNIVASATIG